jgi:hypothetical protein
MALIEEEDDQATRQAYPSHFRPFSPQNTAKVVEWSGKDC